MKKLPVLATIREAYGFVAQHLGAIIGLIWLPMILLTVTGFFVMQHFLQAMAASGNADTLGVEELGPWFFFIASLLLVTMMSVPVTQLALGTRKQGALVHFSFSATEWRLLRSVMGLAGFLVLLLLLLGLAARLTQSSAGGAVAVRDMALLLLLFLAAALYVMVRIAILLPALAVSESSPQLPRAWKLTAGNAGRIFLVVMAILIPVWMLWVLLETMLEIALGRPDLLPAGANPYAMPPAEQVNLLLTQAPLFWGANFLIAPLLLGLLLGAGAAIYRALGDEKVA